MKKDLYNQLWWMLPILGMALLTPFVSTWDNELEAYYYAQGFSTNALYRFMYNYSVYPAQIVAVLSCIALILSYWKPKYYKWRKASLVLVLTMVFGAGFLVHTVLKDHWGRPRPKQVIEYGGRQTFRPYYQPNFFKQPEPSRSFPCGHCTMGFYFFAVSFVLWRYKYDLWGWILFGLALIWGALLGLTRMAQGGHFLSDVLMTGIILWVVAGFFDKLIYSQDSEGQT